ncbi:hypothetical protein VB773_10525 [Haloarculaceae archaeon H-GB2-1]|nr:hypothetical protein [Haloarculaceae archaeon H-GB1-1]MEA5386438.1 hypothetical protein [Haloarculaceae archaeon H-GB11]MEA5407951.1 hypothetical protein [Haloarculaceae archaeon H-GB2-1]
MPTCDRCGTSLAFNDETTKLVEYACTSCHATEIVWKESHRDTGTVTAAAASKTPLGAD